LNYVKFFAEIDVDNTGFITIENFRSFARMAGQNLTEDQLKMLIDDKDLNGDGKVSLREFLAASGRGLPDDQEWFYRWLFAKFDQNSDKGVDQDELRVCLETLEIPYTMSALARFVKPGESLSYPEFKAVFTE
jgi:Ca2+-binding EF-hand superfamily protein